MKSVRVILEIDGKPVDTGISFDIIPETWYIYVQANVDTYVDKECSKYTATVYESMLDVSNETVTLEKTDVQTTLLEIDNL